jgi:hypothetical protein
MPDGPSFVRISVTDHHHKSITAAGVWIEQKDGRARVQVQIG